MGWMLDIHLVLQDVVNYENNDSLMSADDRGLVTPGNVLVQQPLHVISIVH